MVVLLAGCNGILGVHEFSSPDATTETAIVHVFADRFTDDADAVIQRDRQTYVPTRVTTVDGAQLPFDTLADGGIAIHVAAGTAYQVMLNNTPLESDRRDLQFSSIAYGSAAHVAPVADTKVRTTLPSGANADSYRMLSTPVVGAIVMETQAGGLSGTWTAPPLIAADDHFYLASYAATDGTYAAMTAYVSGTISLAPGATTDLPMAPATALAATEKAAFTVDFKALTARVGAVVPDATSAAASWVIDAMQPALEHHPTQLLAYSLGAPADGSRIVQFPNPFPSTTPVVTVAAVALHGSRYAEVFQSAPSNQELAQNCGLPSAPTLNGSALGTSVDLDRTIPAHLAWQVDAPVDFSIVTVLDENGGTVANAYTTRSEVSINNSVFVLGHKYAIQIFAAAGYPDGDFTTAHPAVALAVYQSDLTVIAN